MVILSILSVMIYSFLPKLYKSGIERDNRIKDYIMISKDLRYNYFESELSMNELTIYTEKNTPPKRYYKKLNSIYRDDLGKVYELAYSNMDLYYCAKILETTSCKEWKKKTTKSHQGNYHLWKLVLTDKINEDKFNLVFRGK